MALLNPTLRDEGPTPGSAAHWTLTSVCTAQRIAAFGPAPVRAVEDFERWTPVATAFADGALVLAFFDPIPKGYEGFVSWGAEPFLEALPVALVEPAAFGADGVEGFAWLTAPWAAVWPDVAAEPARFGDASFEDFEGWAPAWLARLAPAAFDGGATHVEAFAGVWTAMKTL